MFSFPKLFNKAAPTELLTSRLFDETTFYQSFISDLDKCKEEVIIESPYITTKRMNMLFPIFNRLIKRGVRITVITRSPQEHGDSLAIQAERAIQSFEALGVQVLLCTDNHHRKLAILDRKILWEGSLNILSQTYSREIMRRINSEVLSREMFDFLKLGKFV